MLTESNGSTLSHPDAEDFRSKPADVAMFGTLNASFEEGGQTWMEKLQTSLEARKSGVVVYNPNVGAGGERKISTESFQLVNSKVIAMNFEQLGGKTALSELRVAVLSAVENDQYLLVNIQKPKEDSDVIRNNRFIGLADLEFFQKIFGNRLKLKLTVGDFDSDSMADSISGFLTNGNAEVTPSNQLISTPVKDISSSHQIAFSGSKRESIRDQLIDKLSLKFGPENIFDTHIENFGINPFMNRLKELFDMYSRRLHVAYMSPSSSSLMANFITSLVIASQYGREGYSVGYLDESHMNDSDVVTVLSHLHALNERQKKEGKTPINENYKIVHTEEEVVSVLADANIEK